MKAHQAAAKILVLLGSTGWIVDAIVHLSDFDKDAAHLNALAVGLQNGFKTVFLMAGIDWIFVAFVAMLAGFTPTARRKTLVLSCGIVELLQAMLALKIMGAFLGTELMIPASIATIVGALLFEEKVSKEARASLCPHE